MTCEKCKDKDAEIERLEKNECKPYKDTCGWVKSSFELIYKIERLESKLKEIEKFIDGCEYDTTIDDVVTDIKKILQEAKE